MMTERLLSKLENKRPAYGIGMKFDDPGIIEAIGGMWDFIWVDMQHGNVGPDRLPHIIRTCDLVGVSALVRPPGQAPGLISLVLNWDAAGVIVPQVHTPEQAKRVVQAAKFPPIGDRSHAGPRIHVRHGLDCIGRANREQLLMLQMESPQAIENAEAIAAIDGVDALMLAPSDLGIRLGLPPGSSLASDEIMAAADRVGAACIRHGKACLAIAREQDHIRRFIDKGFRLFLVGGDSLFLEEGARKLRELVDGLPF